MDRDPDNGTLPVERDSNAELIALAPAMAKRIVELEAALKAFKPVLRPHYVKAGHVLNCTEQVLGSGPVSPVHGPELALMRCTGLNNNVP